MLRTLRPLRAARHPVAFACLAVLAGAPPAFACNADSAATLAACIAGAPAGGAINITKSFTMEQAIGGPIDRDLTINGGGHTIDGNGAYRGFFVGSGNVVINDLAMTRMVAKGGDGGAGYSGGGGGLGAGGAVFVRSGARVTLRNVSFAGNRAEGGKGGDGFQPGISPALVLGGGGGGGMGGNGGDAHPLTGGLVGAAGGGGGTFADGGDGLASGYGGAGGGVTGGQPGAPAVPPVYDATAGPYSQPGGDYGGGAGGSSGQFPYFSSGIPLGGRGGFGGGGGGVNSGDEFSNPHIFTTARTTLPGGRGGFGGGSGGGGSMGQFPEAGGFGAGNGGADFNRGSSFGGGRGGDQAVGHLFGGGGGGGAGLGADVFVMDGGALTVEGTFAAAGGSVAGGAGGAGGAGNSRRSVGGAAFASGIFLQGNGATLTFAPESGTQTVANDIADQTGSGGTGAQGGSVGIVKTGAGTLVLSGTNTYTGGTLVGNGTLAAAHAGSVGPGSITLTGGTAQLTLLGDATLTPSSLGFGNGGGGVGAAAGTTLTVMSNMLFAGSGVVRIGSASDTGTVRLQTIGTGVSVDAYVIDVAGGTWLFDPTVDSVMYEANELTVAAGARLEMGGAQTNVKNLRGGGTIQLGGGSISVGAGAFAGSIAGGTLFKNDRGSTGTLVLTGDNSPGLTVLAAGTLQVGDGGATGSLGSSDISLGADTTLLFRRSGVLTVGGAVAGAGEVVVDGPGTVVMPNAGGHTGLTTVRGGTLAIGMPATGDFRLAQGGQLTSLGGAAVMAPRLEIVDGGGAFAAAPGTLSTFAPGVLSVGGPQLLRIGSPTDTGTVVLAPSAIEGADGRQAVEVAGGTWAHAGQMNALTSTAASVTVRAGAVLDIDPTSSTRIRNLQGEGTIRVGSFASFGALEAAQGRFAGRIEGDGRLVMTGGAGDGLLVLAGDNAYRGVTRILGGTLQVGEGGTTGTLGKGHVENGGSLVFHRADDISVGNGIWGQGTLRKLGAGKLTLEGVNPLSGATSVEAGVLAVNGSLASSAVNVLPGASLGGNGTVGNVNVAAGGFLNAGNSIGRLTMGDLVLAPGSTLQVEANAAGQADRVDAANITVAGANVQVLAAPGAYARNTRYTILTHSGTRTGSFAGVASNLAFLTPSLSYGEGVVYLDLAGPLAATNYASVATTANQAAVANYLQAFANSPATEQAAGLISAVDGMDATQARRAFETLAGSAHIAATQVALAAGRHFSQMLQARGFEASGAGKLTTSPGFTATVHGAPDPTEPQARKGLGLTGNPASSSTRGLWAQTFGGGGRMEGDGNGGGLRYDATGLVAGFDHEVDSALALGFALGRTRSHWASRSPGGALGSGTVTSHQAGAYARFAAGAWKLGTEATFGLHRFTTNRTVDLGTPQNASSSHRATERSLGVQAEYAPHELRAGQWQLRPVSGARHARYGEDGFSESGAAGASLTVGARKLRSTTLHAGARLLHAFQDGRGDFQLQATLSHLAGDNEAFLAARMAGQPASFTASGTPLPRDALTLSAALSRQLSPTLSVFAGAAAEYRGSGHSAWSAVAGVRKRW